ncbi:MAG: hypothetical protein A2X64_11425 [Ignavibacteria bacterium GWF2_33_9]|nr:MAG: hypothetical protein A2X64_11425 [Ignavibacteria bacterium GWF2_33_9]
MNKSIIFILTIIFIFSPISMNSNVNFRFGGENGNFWRINDTVQINWDSNKLLSDSVVIYL